MKWRLAKLSELWVWRRKASSEESRCIQKKRRSLELNKCRRFCMGKGLCECGCGGKTEIIKRSVASRFLLRGRHRRFIYTHQNRLQNKGHDVDPITGCWIWSGYVGRLGYPGLMSFNGKKYSAHKAYYLMSGRRIRNGLQLDHLCKRRACVNPCHMEPFTPAENTRRSTVAKLSKHCVRDIVKSLKSAKRGDINKIAIKYGVSHTCIS